MNWPTRFGVPLVVTLSLNAVPMWITWRGFRTDGIEQIGVPFPFFERGGYAYQQSWYPEILVVDIFLALAFSCGVARIFHDGWIAGFRRIQTLGLEHLHATSKDHGVKP